MATAQKEKKEEIWVEPPRGYYEELFLGESRGKMKDFKELVRGYQSWREVGENHANALRNTLSEFKKEHGREPDNRTLFEFIIYAGELNSSIQKGKPDYGYIKGLIIASRSVSIAFEPARKNEDPTIRRIKQGLQFVEQAKRKYDEMQVSKQYEEEMEKLRQTEKNERTMASVPTRTGQQKTKDESIMVGTADITIGGVEVRLSLSGKSIELFDKLMKENPEDRNALADLIMRSDFVLLVTKTLVVSGKSGTKETYDPMSKSNVADAVMKGLEIKIGGLTLDSIPKKKYKEEIKKYSRE
ncbi:MAG: hypothetical protein N3H30_02080 [Candidatus Micrarchaeota archaeon]|nr:hypothetical protein [Candidatus Micrarchaeota archaeon]